MNDNPTSDDMEVFVINLFDEESRLITNYVATTMDIAMELSEIIMDEDEEELIAACTVMRLKMDTMNQYETLH